MEILNWFDFTKGLMIGLSLTLGTFGFIYGLESRKKIQELRQELVKIRSDIEK